MFMKPYSFFCALGLTALLAACHDQMEYGEYDDSQDWEYISSHWAKVGGFMTYVYRDLDYDFGQKLGGALLASATDESVYSHSGNAVETFYNGTWSASNTNSSVWGSAWEGISYCNLVLDEFTGLTFEDWELDKNYAVQMKRYNNYQYECRWARALYYFELASRYGDVPLKTSHISADEANALPRTPAAEVFDFIVSECDAIKDSIQHDYASVGISNNENGRADHLAVLALKARAALYHASPLFNKENDKSLWEQAVLACKELVDTAEAYGKGLNKSYDALFASDNYTKCTDEILFGYRQAVSNSFEKYNFPIGLENAGGGNCPTQNLVDAYEMKATGLPISDPASGYDPNDPYAGRDSRLAATVAVNGETWPAGNTLETFYGGANAQPISYATPTGYYLKKYCSPSVVISTKNSKPAAHCWVVFRMGEAYLNLAEAILNYTGSGYQTATINGKTTQTAAYYINKVRARVGLPKLPEGLDADSFTERYRNERFVELAFEGHRFFDLRRWLVAGQAKYTTIRTLDLERVISSTDTTLRFNIVEDATTRANWSDKMYLFPIPQSEMLKTSGNWEQNPGW